MAGDRQSEPPRAIWPAPRHYDGPSRRASERCRVPRPQTNTNRPRITLCATSTQRSDFATARPRAAWA
eukprot:7821916-Alexandrium_andersonii.AAC.1